MKIDSLVHSQKIGQNYQNQSDIFDLDVEVQFLKQPFGLHQGDTGITNNATCFDCGTNDGCTGSACRSVCSHC